MLLSFNLGVLCLFSEGLENFRCRPTKKRPVNLVVKTLLLVREIRGSRPGPVKSDTISPVTRHRYDISSNFKAVLPRR